MTLTITTSNTCKRCNHEVTADALICDTCGCILRKPRTTEEWDQYHAHNRAMSHLIGRNITPDKRNIGSKK